MYTYSYMYTYTYTYTDSNVVAVMLSLLKRTDVCNHVNINSIYTCNIYIHTFVHTYKKMNNHVKYIVDNIRYTYFCDATIAVNINDDDVYLEYYSGIGFHINYSTCPT
jgi:hypothetical protein